MLLLRVHTRGLGEGRRRSGRSQGEESEAGCPDTLPFILSPSMLLLQAWEEEEEDVQFTGVQGQEPPALHPTSTAKPLPTHV